MENRNRFTEKENKRGYQRGKGRRRDKFGVWDLQGQTTIYKIDKQKGYIL